MLKHDYSQYLKAYSAGASSADLARQAGINPGQMYRGLRAGEVVHHINGNKQDNRNENLLVCTDSYHRLIHARMDALAACGNPNWLRCRYCHTYDAPEHLSVNGFPYHRACAAAYQRDRKLRAAR